MNLHLWKDVIFTTLVNISCIQPQPKVYDLFELVKIPVHGKYPHLSHEHGWVYFSTKKKKVVKKIAKHVWWTYLDFWFRIFFFGFVKKKPMHVLAHAWNKILKLWNLMNPHASPMNMLGFLSIQLFVPKIKVLARLFRILVLMCRFCAGPQSEKLAAFTFSY